MNILFTNSLGTYVLDSNFRVKDKILFSPEERHSQSRLVTAGSILDSEKKLAKKHKVRLLTLRTSPDIDCFCDEKTFIGVSNALYKESEKVHEADIAITKRDIKDAFTRDHASIFIIQAVNTIKELDRAANMLTHRLREWYGYAAPEVVASVQDNEAFSKLVAEAQRSQLLEKIGLTQEKSMGARASEADLRHLQEMARQVLTFYAMRREQESYLEQVMAKECPNIKAIAGTMIAAKLLATAGSLKALSQFPASTIQVLGAEKALFRHMTTKSKPPKYGHLIHHPLIAKAAKENRGKVARGLADKLAIASKVDYFKGAFIGNKLRQKLEDKFR
ncbi:hypothetical protein HYU19_01845 [Candidatus Woesearchaeota archaeon]|nr:hypothetical protein [Candidatus Woesearchaeota archaeon]